jgi:hypothetical protein
MKNFALALLVLAFGGLMLTACPSGEKPQEPAPPAETETTDGTAVPAEGEQAPAEGEQAPAEGEQAPAEGEGEGTGG